MIGPNEYFYYAILDSRGEFYPSSNKVGIDTPLPESYQLERTPERISEIQSERDAFDQQVQVNFENFINDERFNGPDPEPFRLAVVLVDFTPSIGENYEKADFDTLFFSTDYYITDIPTNFPLSPDDEPVYGSLRDYYNDQSLGRLDIIGKFGDNRSIIS